jgi:hypothetical protein
VGTRDRVSEASKNAPIYCDEGRILLERFGDCVHELLLLHDQQFVAVTNGDTACDRFDLLIHMANEDKQRAKYEYLRHLETHGCSGNDDIHET